MALYFKRAVFFDKIESYLKLNENRIHAHRLRKTFATRLLKKGCPVTTIQKLLGHTDIKMTMIYLDIDNTMIENDYFNFYPYEKKEPVIRAFFLVSLFFIFLNLLVLLNNLHEFSQILQVHLKKRLIFVLFQLNV